MFRLRIAPLVIGFLLLLIAAGCGGSSNSSGSGSNGSGSGGSNGGSSGGSGGGGESTSPTVSNFALTPRVAAQGNS